MDSGAHDANSPFHIEIADAPVMCAARCTIPTRDPGAIAV
jgi:hypothetical protein